MSLIDSTSSFSYTSVSPIVSPCGGYVAYVNGSKLVIRSADTLSLERVIKIQLQNKPQFLKVTQIQWEPSTHGDSKKVAALIGGEDTIKIYDLNDETVDITITEDDVFGIDRFQWLPMGQEVIQTAYSGSKQVIVFSKSELTARIYSLDYSHPVMTIEKPKFSKVIFRPESDIFTFICSMNNEITAENFINKGSSVVLFNKVDLNYFSNLTESIEWSPDGQWILCNDSTLGEISISVFSLFNNEMTRRRSFFNFQDELDPLGAIDAKWLNSSSILVSDHHENIHKLDFMTGLDVSYTLRHSSLVNSTTIWSRNGNMAEYIKKQTPFKVPQIIGLPLASSGIYKFKSKNDYLFVVTKSMPTSIFIWDISSNSSKEPLEVIITNSKIRDLEITNNGLLLVTSEDSLTLWRHNYKSPMVIPNTDEDDQLIKGAMFVSSSIGLAKILVRTNNSFHISDVKLVHSSLMDHMDTEQIDLLRNGSPVLVDDLTKVVQLANGVQQSEWGHNQTFTSKLEDTFLTKKKKPLLRDR